MANKKYTSVKNDFCLMFNSRTKITPANDDGTISQVAFEFTKIEDIEKGINIKAVDVLAVVSAIGEQEQLKLKDGTFKDKKTYVLADQSMVAITFTVWGSDNIAKYASLKEGTVIALKQATISEFKGKSLNHSNSTNFVIGYKSSDATKLTQWYQANPAEVAALRCLTQTTFNKAESTQREGTDTNKANNLRVSNPFQHLTPFCSC